MSSSVAPARVRIARLAPRLAEEARERVRLRVVPRTRARTSRVPFVALVTVLMLGGVVGLLLFNTSMQQASFAATALQGQADALSARQQTLAMELDGLRDPQRVALEARRLGMVPNCSPMFLRLNASGTGATVSGTPAPSTTDCVLRVAPYPARKPRVLDVPPTVVTVPASPVRGRPASPARPRVRPPARPRVRPPARPRVRPRVRPPARPRVRPLPAYAPTRSPTRPPPHRPGGRRPVDMREVS